MIIIRLLTRVGLLILWPFIMVYRGIWWTLKKIGAGFAFIGRGIWWVIRKVGSGFAATGRAIWATPMAIIRTPMRMYRRVTVWRNWILAKVEYLQSESQKWRTAFNIAKSPYTALRLMGLNPQAAVAVLFAGSTVGGGVIVNETILDGPSFSAGDHGIYTAPSDIPVAYSTANNTLRIDLNAIPVGLIDISDVTIGTAYANSALPAGESHAIVLGGTTSTSSYIEIGHLIIDRWRCSQFQIKDVETHTLNIIGNASDGQSLAPTAGVPRRRGIGGGNRADEMSTRGGYYDQIKVRPSTNNVNGKVDVLRMINITSKGGPCIVQRIKAGTIDILLSEFGRSDGFANKDMIVGTSTIAKGINIVDNVEAVIAEVP